MNDWTDGQVDEAKKLRNIAGWLGEIEAIKDEPTEVEKLKAEVERLKTENEELQARVGKPDKCVHQRAGCCMALKRTLTITRA
ncbi:unnamed protein product [marine sediment metagenome]|uniref:Uncharacterized protein n=1 Tax=marine sediment metagenome TaxID=412755 RepID=X1BYW6_9ZZZZ